MNGTMHNASMTGTTVKENNGVSDMNNMAFYYHALPPVDDILRSWVNGASTEKIIPDWKESSIDFFVVVGMVLLLPRLTNSVYIVCRLITCLPNRSPFQIKEQKLLILQVTL